MHRYIFLFHWFNFVSSSHHHIFTSQRFFFIMTHTQILCFFSIIILSGFSRTSARSSFRFTVRSRSVLSLFSANHCRNSRYIQLFHSFSVSTIFFRLFRFLCLGSSLNSWKRGDLVSVFYSFFFRLLMLSWPHITRLNGRHHEDLNRAAHADGKVSIIGLCCCMYDARLDASPATSPHWTHT